MINPKNLTDELRQCDIGLITCVPCSLLKPLINQSIMDPHLSYISAVSEGEAVGIAVGSSLTGKMGVAMLQNSGLGNIVNPVTSLTNIYRIPVFFIISLRGDPERKEAIQHKIMGAITYDVLKLLNIYYEELQANSVVNLMKNLHKRMISTQYPVALIVKRGLIHSCDLTREERNISFSEGKYFSETINDNYLLSRHCAIKKLSELLNKEDLVISATGGISRELFSFNDRPENFYMQGSMGTTAAIGLGISLQKPHKSVVILDGDGSLLMRMGSLATIGYYKPARFIHIVLDNESYQTTGGQNSVSTRADFARIAIAAGYQQSVTIDRKELLQKYWNKFYNMKGPSLLHIKLNKETIKKPNRPDITPEDIRDRFMAAI